MLTVEAYELVRRKYHLDGMSIRQIAKGLGQEFEYCVHLPGRLQGMSCLGKP